MPTGVYERTEKQREAARQRAYKLHKLPKTEKQIQQIRQLGKKHGPEAGLNSKGKPRPHKGNVFGDDIVKHHNDFCHGELRSDDITYMSSRGHSSLHAKLKYQDREKDDKGRFK